MPSPGFPQMGATDGPPGGSNMPGGMPPYFTVSNHILSVKLKKPNSLSRDLCPIFVDCTSHLWLHQVTVKHLKEVHHAS